MQLFGANKVSGWGIEMYDQFHFRAINLFIHGAGSGILVYDSFETYIDNCKIQEVYRGGGIGIKVDGVDDGGAETWITRTLLSNYPTEPGETSVGINVRTGGGMNLMGVTQVGHGIGMLVNPGVDQVAHWGFVINSNFDTNRTHGVSFAPVDTGIAKGWVFTNSWSASNTLDGFNGVVGSGVIDGIALTAGSRAYNNQQRGIYFEGGINVSVQDFRSCGNGIAASGVHGGVVFSGTTHFTVSGLTSGVCDTFVTPSQSYGLYVLGAADNYTINDVKLTGNVTGGLLDEGTGLFRTLGAKLISHAERFPTVASASAFAIPNTDPETVVVTGTTALTTMTPAWWGRRIRLIFSNAAPGGVATGGAGNFAFAQAVSVITNGSVDCEYGPTAAWYCR